MISFDAALALLRNAVVPLQSEKVALDAAAGRVLAAPVVAAIASPRHDVATRDGYAIRHVDCRDGAVLTVIGEAAPGGAAAGPVGAGHAVRIFTGATVPDGADRVLMQEDTARGDQGGTIIITQAIDSERYIRRTGSDFAAGDVVLALGVKLAAKSLVLAAGADCATVVVTRRPRVAIIATGDELAAPGQSAFNDRLIPDSITPGISTCVADWGGTVTSTARLGDNLAALVAAAASALRSADVLVITGGASVGDRDFARAMVEPHGLILLFDTVAIKPGKPVWCGLASLAGFGGEQGNRKWVIGLPGNPTSAMVTARVLLAPLIAGLLGQTAPDLLAWWRLPLAAALPANGPRESFIRASYEQGGLVPLPNQDSGSQSPLAAADYLIRCAPGQSALLAGAIVPCIQF